LLYSVHQKMREKQCGPEIPEINCMKYNRRGFKALLLKFCCTKCNHIVCLSGRCPSADFFVYPGAPESWGCAETHGIIEKFSTSEDT
ncbi:hypothetical protein, partial [Paenibacillus riograndensis]|uniref:hypothetical protein n=1 Tax=Paenibacillus riograndensis TaxID=483937 RepID=UPI001B7F896A